MKVFDAVHGKIGFCSARQVTRLRIVDGMDVTRVAMRVFKRLFAGAAYLRRDVSRTKSRWSEQLEPRCCLSAVTFIAKVIDEPEGMSIKAIEVGDFWASSKMEVLSLQIRGHVSTYTNLDEPMPVDTHFNVALPDNLAYALNMTVADVNGDGRDDLLVSLPELVWYPHIDDESELSHARIIDDSSAALNRYQKEILVFDLDGDADLDVISGSRTYRNVDGRGTYQLLEEAEDMDLSAIGDIDGDGDMDVAGMTSHLGIAWCRNSDGLRMIDDCTVIQSGFDNLDDLELIDVDGDGDNDIVIGADSLSWMENYNGRGDFLESRRLAENVFRLDYVSQADMNQDGLPDLVYTSQDSVGWFPMTNRGLSNMPQLIATPGHWRDDGATDVADIDGDMDLDVVVARRNEIVGYENRIVGDANDDGVFDSADLVAVLAAGKYENVESNAKFDEGDWDQDGDFDSSDLVRAFHAGHYEVASKPPAAVDVVFAASNREAFVP